jgi:hypothetical protein
MSHGCCGWGILRQPGGQVESPGQEFKLGSLSQDQFPFIMVYLALLAFWYSEKGKLSVNYVVLS